MTIENCDDCLHPMREHTHHHRCPRCGATKQKTAYNQYLGRCSHIPSLYPNHKSRGVHVTNGFLKLAAYTALMILLIMALAALSDPVMQSIRGGF